MTPDPIGFEDGPNLYAYVHNQPLVSIDPDGQFVWFLAPLALSIAADYCIPAAAVYLSQYAGGMAAASLISGFINGYNDPLSSAFDLGTSSLGDSDLTSFICNRAGMAAGTLLACRPTAAASKGADVVINAAGRQIIGSVAKSVETSALKTASATVKSGAQATAKRTGQVAEQYIAKKGTASLDALSKAGQVMDRGGLTKAGRALDKHGNRVGSIFPKATGNAASKNMQGQFHLDDVLTNPKSISSQWKHRDFGNILDIQAPGQKGARFSQNGDFIGFLE